MIELASPYTVAVLVYGIALAGSLVWLNRVPAERRTLPLVATLLVALSAVTNTLLAMGIGTIPLNGSDVALPSFLNNLIAYPILWGIAAAIAMVSRRTLAIVTGIPFVQVLAYQVTAVTTGAVALASTSVVIGGHLVLLVIFVKRIWPATTHLADERRLLHWKARNLLLFLLGMLIVYAFVALAGAFSTFGSNVLTVYIEMLIRIGFAGFLFVNVDALASESTVTDDLAETPNPGAT